MLIRDFACEGDDINDFITPCSIDCAAGLENNEAKAKSS
jgi:hypothetical protein